jgi:hypothetical protein
MSEFKKNQLKRKEQVKANWGCFFSCAFVFGFWFGLGYWALQILSN